jgi:PadR family transcriptional regulator, regulatory protein AphA
MKSKPRLSLTSFAILALLDQLGKASSYDLKQVMDKSIQNFWPVPHTTAYEEPARLAACGLLSVRQDEGGRRRKVYALTDEGREALRGWALGPEAAPPVLRDEMILKMFAGADPAAFAAARREWHQAKLRELQGYLDELGAKKWERSARTLVAGLIYHRKMLEMLDELNA